jgi:hypothetical protein
MRPSREHSGIHRSDRSHSLFFMRRSAIFLHLLGRIDYLEVFSDAFPGPEILVSPLPRHRVTEKNHSFEWKVRPGIKPGPPEHQSEVLPTQDYMIAVWRKPPSLPPMQTSRPSTVTRQDFARVFPNIERNS